MKKAERTNILAKYLRDIGRYPLLTREEEQELAKKKVKGDKQAAEKLVVHNLRFVVTVVHKKFSGYIRARKVDELDLIQAGNIGLMTAVKKFDPSRGVRLTSYAVWWIRSSAQRFLVPNYSMVKLGGPSFQRALFWRMNDIRNIIHSKDPEEKEGIRQYILDRNKAVTRKQLQAMEERVAWNDSSTDLPIGQDPDGLTISDLLVYPDSEYEVKDQDDMEFMRHHFDRVIKVLSPQEKEVINRRWLGKEVVTLDVIGKAWGLSRERIRQIEEKAISKIRQVLGKEATAIEQETLGSHVVIQGN